MSSKIDIVSYSSGRQNDGFSDEYADVGDDAKAEAVIRMPDVENEQPVSPKRPGTSRKAITFSWSEVNVFAKSKGGGLFGCCSKNKEAEPKQILNNVSGVVRPGELLALMGASGAGKTTLLNVLTFRNLGEVDVAGKIFANGVQVQADELTAISGYVQQQDLFIGTLTVKEILTFQAWLRMDQKMSKEQKSLRIQEVLNELGLTKCADTLVGVPGRTKGISGGEMKRLAFACEVLTDPQLLFCDEPTSGLDSFMAENVVSVLKSQADKGRTIIATIHQPSSEVFSMFDRLMLLAEGRIAFAGSSEDAHGFFSRLGYPCPSNYNPADFFIHTLAVVPGREAASRQRVKLFADSFQSSDKGSELAKSAAAGGMSSTKPPAWESDLVRQLSEAKSGRGVYKASWTTQFAAILWRTVRSMVREPLVLKIRLIQTIFIAVVLGLIYFQQELDQRGVQNINGVVFLLLTNMTFSNMFSVVNVFCEELPIFLREHFNGMYRTETYFVGKMLAELPLFVIFPAVFAAITYFMIGFEVGATRFLVYAAVLVLVSNAAASFGYMISAAAANVTLALSIAPPVIIPLMLFGGFFLNTTSIPVYLEWLKWLSWFNYAFELLAVNQWRGIEDIHCDTIPTPFPGTTPSTTAAYNTTQEPGLCQGFSNGEAVLTYFRFNPDNDARNVVCLVALLVGYRILAYIFLKLRASKQR